MEFKILLLSVVIILLAFDCSTQCCEGIKPGNDVFLQNDAKFLLGRKMLQVIDDDKTPHISDPQSTLTSSANKNVVRVVKENDVSEAADEVANLMQRDYRGAARRRSPIHNHQPNN
ncbi:hypothetical protein CASFOL_032920 [Castilleja foliolosa]|uniref:Uncharacterized protein n=1 Tax=Castilleja foliolosa TaxID=1961234 RepID=A0ABD3C3F7_9LAMI